MSSKEIKDKINCTDAWWQISSVAVQITEDSVDKYNNNKTQALSWYPHHANADLSGKREHLSYYLLADLNKLWEKTDCHLFVKEHSKA